jgi:t-SNARE complex subunit (syntaxin)
MSGLKQQYVPCSESDYHRLLLSDRERDITQISSDVYKVHSIYADLGELVDGQQDNVDDIENQVADAHGNTDGGVKQLAKAVKNQRTRTTCCLYALLIGTVILGVVVVCVVVFSHYS